MAEIDYLIRVPENEFKPLLDREQVTRDVGQLKPWTDLTLDVVNYGSNLIPRCFGSSERTLTDIVVIGSLLKQVVAMLDAVDVLARNGSLYASELPMRAIFESCVYIEWILSGDSDTKAIYYYVFNLRRKRRSAQKVIPGTPEAKDFTEVMNSSFVSVGPPNTDVQAQAKKMMAEIDRLLSLPKYSRANEQFEQLKKGRLYDQDWYVPLGPKNLRMLAKLVRMGSLYSFFYSGASEVMHGSNCDKHIQVEGERIVFQPIRSLEKFSDVARFSVSMALHSYRALLNQYRPGELPAFGRKYVEKWQKYFMNFPHITCESQISTI